MGEMIYMEWKRRYYCMHACVNEDIRGKPGNTDIIESAEAIRFERWGFIRRRILETFTGSLAVFLSFDGFPELFQGAAACNSWTSALVPQGADKARKRKQAITEAAATVVEAMHDVNIYERLLIYLPMRFGTKALL
ncbi:hypothetical protein H6P81_011999 [Aristolochia fimbriata]|uniref:Uncharacterized protein n=1 Tax=Aristolochia fimbriata TaxID=158543 RepID=A0AAV7EDE4_ARIFI|nr:hypothetical protein H6P81_011999 [Aristolochia fimbriata]